MRTAGIGICLFLIITEKIKTVKMAESREMDTVFYEVQKEGTGEYEEKKSRFIAVVHPAETKEEALSFIAEKKKLHHDARHNCSAYIVTDADGGIITHFSDDGEPSQTAGKPMLDVMQHEGLIHAVCVVTRYFGGVLLGTGGLVRAYTESTKAAIKDATLRERRRGYVATISCDYPMAGKVEYTLRQIGAEIGEKSYTNEVTYTVKIPTEQKETAAARMTEQTAGQIKLSWSAETYI